MDFVNRIAIIGVGMLGGSIGLACKERLSGVKVIGFGRDKSKLDHAIKLNAIDEYFLSYSEGISNCDIVIVCTPVKVIPSIFGKIRSFLKNNCVVTDVGSTKFEVVNNIYKKFGSDSNFIGSHPMAGSEKTGVESATANLYKNALVIVTEDDHSNKELVKRVSLFWEALGARTIKLSSFYHDRVVCETSHLTHLVASCLSYTLLYSLDNDDIKSGIFGNGLLDTTRIAEGDPQMWLDIFTSNKDNMIKAIHRFQNKLREFTDLLINDDKHSIMEYLLKAKEFREKLVSLM